MNWEDSLAQVLAGTLLLLVAELGRRTHKRRKEQGESMRPRAEVDTLPPSSPPPRPRRRF